MLLKFLNIRRKLFDKIKFLDETLLQLNDEILLTVLKIYNEQVDVQLLNASIDYIINSDRLTGSLIYTSLFFFFFLYLISIHRVTEMDLLLAKF